MKFFFFKYFESVLINPNKPYIDDIINNKIAFFRAFKVEYCLK